MIDRWKRSLPLLIPLLLAALFAGLLEACFSWREAREREAGHTRWERTARRLLGTLGSSLTIESQLERMAWRMTSTLSLQARCSPHEHLPDAISGAFRRCFPVSHRPAGTRLYACTIGPEGQPRLITGSGLAGGKARIMEDLFRILLIRGRRAGETGAARRLMRGLFGDDTDPALFPRSRSGLATPVTFEGQRHLFLWNGINTGPGTLLGVVLLFPDAGFAPDAALRYSLDTVCRQSRGRFLPWLQPFPQNGRLEPVDSPAYVKGSPLAPVWRACGVAAAGHAALPVGGVIRTDRFWGMKGFLSFDHPLQAWIFSRPPTAPPALSRLCRQAALAALSLAVLLLIVTPLAEPRPFISLRASFGFLLLFIGLTPLTLLLLTGTSFLEIQTDRRIQQAGQAGLDLLLDADRRAAFVTRELARSAEAVASSCTYIDTNISTSPARLAAWAGRVRRAFRRTGFHLDVMHVYRPGAPALAFPPHRADGTSNREKGDFFAPIVRHAHRLFVPEATDRELPPLDEKQRDFERILDSMGITTSRNFYLNFLEHSELFRLTGGETSLYLSQTHSDHGSVLAHVVFEAEADKALRRQLLANLARIDAAAHIGVAVAERKPGGVSPIFHLPKNGPVAPAAGTPLRRVMETAARLNTEIISRSGGTLYVAAPCQKAGNLVTGIAIPLQLILDKAARNRLLLFLFAGIFTAILLVLGRTMLEHLIQPLALVEKGLRQAASGGDPGRLALPRADELGQMTRAFDGMIDGLRERRYLGKFVSGALERTLHDTSLDQAVKPRAIVGTVLVSDIRSFTTLSEAHPAPAIVEMLNRHMAALTPEIERHGGRVDRFIGDAIVAVFEDTPRESGLRQALRAAMGMMSAHAAHQKSRSEKALFTFEIGIGIDHGPLMIGTLGRKGRLEFALIGESRHRAEQMEAASKHGSSTRIILSPEANKLASAFAETAKLAGTEGHELITLHGEAS